MSLIDRNHLSAIVTSSRPNTGKSKADQTTPVSFRCRFCGTTVRLTVGLAGPLCVRVILKERQQMEDLLLGGVAPWEIVTKSSVPPGRTMIKHDLGVPKDRVQVTIGYA